ncbi:MAG TPA: YidC/Oxa1 family membrane protein insertase [Actinomycetota bacterium]|nr:YidC/Oxa1 family membrane protein insertase [Actinomycetota bacterium]
MGFFELFAGALAGFYAFIADYGLAIILLTITVRLLLLPLSIKQTRSMREMQVIQPQIKALQAKYKGDRQKLNEATMALYKEHGVNPFGGCLPMLLQIPVMIGLFQVLQKPLEYLGFMPKEGMEGVVRPTDFVPEDVQSSVMQSIQNSALADDLTHRALEVNQFLGIRLDCKASAALSGADPSLVGEACGSGLISALPYLILVLLVGATTYYQQKQMQASNPNPQGPQAAQMAMFAKIMPVMFMVFSFNFPAGLVVYFLTTNVWTIGQQYLILHRLHPPITASAPLAAGGKASTGKAVAKPDAGKPPGKTTKQGSAKQPTQRSSSAKKKKR